MPLLFASRLLGDATASSGGTPPATPTLSIVDNGDGTGAVATVSGSTAGSTNTVSAYRSPSPAGALTALASASRIGDGTVSLALPNAWYLANVASQLNGIYSAPSADYSFSSSGGASHDYGEILAAVLMVLKADANLTGSAGLLAPFDPNGVSPSRSNSIFYQRPPVAKPPTPCIVLADLHADPAAPIAEEPTHYASVPLVIYVYGSSRKLRPVMWEIDEALKPTACASGAMDTSDWKIVQIDSGQKERRGWMTVGSDEQLTDLNGVFVEQRAKVFVIRAASVHN